MNRPSTTLRERLREIVPAISGQRTESAPASSDGSSLLELLSDRLLTDFPVATWRSVFLGSGYERIHFRQQPATLLCCDPPQPEWGDGELEALATRFGGHFEPFRGTPVLSFPGPREALETALLLQRSCTARIRVSLLTGTFTMARFELSGLERTLTIGAQLDSVLGSMRRSIPRSIKLCPQSHAALAVVLERRARGAIVTTEYHGDDVTSALITLAPPRSEVSTFAGLGLT